MGVVGYTKIVTDSILSVMTELHLLPLLVALIILNGTQIFLGKDVPIVSYTKKEGWQTFMREGMCFRFVRSDNTWGSSKALFKKGIEYRK